ncbi:hypothetical protein ASPWEDRAFT_689518 [Aspergillus wentii DTO 134E9]|uniref:Serine hydrolase domain-containing protein n=1 Tax=Aspergillus wentii DTO 134E9 TaxID=1073089 RepID=A0A1L9R8M4_ASPWE|nr:uncharacterized protein ASPWEDRAFT_689518 [Aspergillus wentii DTO 134E9]KAI9925091.1 hypothetical protein MW887_006499 [Aspergillus wentii]OJJ31272.1 hypothetical protein ASPWEDRAFT_689518 [Aspergillus wentii DTO 134E9]
MPIASPDTLDKPRILCLHGGGSSAEIFRIQTQRLAAALSPYFRLVFVQAPFPATMAPDLQPFYGSMGLDSCRQWYQPGTSNETIITQLESTLQTAMATDAGTGKYTAVLGFSQGAKMAMSILLENQFRRDADPTLAGFAGVHFEFGIILAGRALPYALSKRTLYNGYFDAPGEVPTMGVDSGHFDDRLRTPTLHVHGLRDPGIELHRQLMHDFADEGSAVLVEWNEGHRLPIKTPDVKAFTEGILKVAGMC